MFPSWRGSKPLLSICFEICYYSVIILFFCQGLNWGESLILLVLIWSPVKHTALCLHRLSIQTGFNPDYRQGSRNSSINNTNRRQLLCVSQEKRRISSLQLGSDRNWESCGSSDWKKKMCWGRSCIRHWEDSESSPCVTWVFINRTLKSEVSQVR